MGKGTKRKTVWRTFSFENGNGNANGTANGTDIKGISTPADRTDHSQENNPIASNGTVTNGKFVSNWRYRRIHQTNEHENLSSETESHDDDYQKSNDDQINHHSNGYRHQYYHSNNNRPYFKRWPLTDKHYQRNGFRKMHGENGHGNGANENGTDYRDNYENDTNHTQSNRFISNRSSAAFHSNRHFNGSYRKWDNRNYNHHSNGGLGSYNRGFRKQYFAHSDQIHTAINRNNEHQFDKNDLTENRMINGSDQYKTDVEHLNHKSMSSQTPHEQQDDHQNQDRNKITEDEYTRISTPRSEVLFKKGYLTRAKKYVGSTMPSSSNDSGSVSVVSNEETAPYYSIQSMSPENPAFVNGTNCNDGTPITYPTDGYNPDVPLIFSSGFYDNNGYFYVNPYVPGHFDQFNGPIGLMPFDSTAATNGAYSGYTSPSPPTMAVDAKSLDGDNLNEYNKQHSINSEDVSTSSFSENVSINNDSVTPQSPLTPPPSPLSPDSQLNNDKLSNCEENGNDSGNGGADGETADETNSTKTETETETETETDTETKPIEDMPDQPANDEVEITERETVIPENYSVPYYSPFIFVPPISFVPGGHLTHPRRNRFYRRYSNHHYNRFRKYNRYSYYNDKFNVPTTWSEAPDETTVNIVQDGMTNTTETAVDTTNSNDINTTATTTTTTITPTLEQCDIILKNSKLNSNVSEFVPQNKRMIVVPLQVAPTSQAPIFILPSQLNVNVPEFLPKNYTPLAKPTENSECEQNSHQNTFDNKIDLNDANSIEATDAPKSTENDALNGNNSSNSIEENDLETKTVQNKSSFNYCASNNLNEISKKQTHVRKLSDLLKTTSTTTNDNGKSKDGISSSRIDGNKDNSHINLKADIEIKYRNKVWFNRHNENNKNKDTDMNLTNNNKLTKTSQQCAYPDIKINRGRRNSTNKITATAITNTSSSSAASASASASSSPSSTTAMATATSPNTNISYARMVIPTATTQPDHSINSNQSQNVTPSKSKSINHSPVTANNNNYNNKPNNRNNNNNNNGNKITNLKKKTSSETVKPMADGPIEWFTVGAKGKKQALLNNKQASCVDFTANLTQSHESKEEQVNNVAEELQLDIKKDSDLALDIMDSLTISEQIIETKSTQSHSKIEKKKPTTVKNSKKKPIKDKTNKESKRSRTETFNIIEPNFEVETKKKVHDATHASIMDETKPDTIVENNQIDGQLTTDELTFDPNVFTPPLNLQVDLGQEKVANVGNSLRLSATKPIRSLLNSFDIYQTDFTFAHSQQLQQEEEMVNKVLEQLKQTEVMPEHDETLINTTEQPIDIVSIEEQIIDEMVMPLLAETQQIESNDLNSTSNVPINFDINAKPQQNVYSSNHFLGHFFGDKNDKCDLVDGSAALSSSDQTNLKHNADKTMNACILHKCADHEHGQNHDFENKDKIAIEQMSLEENLKTKKNTDGFDKQLNRLNDKQSEIVAIKSTKATELIEQKHTIENGLKSMSIDDVNQMPIAIGLPWLRIVDTQMLEQQKKQAYPITTAVSKWLNQTQKEQLLRLPFKYNENVAMQKRTKSNSQTSQCCSSIGTEHYCNDHYLSDDTSSLTSEKDDKEKLTVDATSIDDDDYDDEEDEMLNFWKLDGLSMTSLTPQTPPICNSIYGNSIDYANLTPNKNELHCSNIIEFDQHHVELKNDASTKQINNNKTTINGFGTGQTKQISNGADYKPAPEVYCTIM